MELICVNSAFTGDQLAFYQQFGVTTPKEGEFYTPRSISKNSEGNWEILLNEVVNPVVPIKHLILGITYKEPAWNLLKRFRNIDNTEITVEQVKEFKEQEKFVEK